MESVQPKGPEAIDWTFIGAQMAAGRARLKKLPRHAPRGGASWPLVREDDIITTAYEAWLLGIYEGPLV